MTWGEVLHVRDRVRNMVRRGYLLATYNDGRILRARVRTGVDIENDHLDVIQPVGFSAHVAPGPRTEVLTLDVGADPSRRVVLAIFGDRTTHPQPDEGEAFFYAPGDPSRHIRIKLAGYAGRARNSGRPAGLEIAMGDLPIVINSEKTVSIEAPEGVNVKTQTHTFEGDVIIRGDVHIEGNLRVTGTVTATRFVEG